jgi:hypothetical protein
VLADVRRHQPAEPARTAIILDTQRLVLLDEGNVAPGVGPQRGCVVVGTTRENEAVVGDEVPLFAGNLAGLAADADRRVGEEADPRLCLLAVALRPGTGIADEG